MKNVAILSCVMVLACASCGRECVEKPEEALIPVTFENVRLEDDFWLPRLIIQKDRLVPFALENTETAVENLKMVGNYLRHGVQQKMYDLPRYVASDLFKVMEGASYLLTLEENPELEGRMDEIIDIIADAQCEDGYLYEPLSVPETMYPLSWGYGDRPYSYVLHSHELYDMGHMYEAAVAYYKATGKRKWLDVAQKSARHINKVFFEGDPAYNDGKPVNQAPGHEEIELALVKLYQATGDSLYLHMAKKFIDIRGVTYVPDGVDHCSASYAQQHQPVRMQRKAVGHSVRALYLYSGMADVMGLFSDKTLYPALDAIWHDIADTKIHINGGLGSVRGIEGFGPEYVLPNKDTYDETCAGVGNVLFNYRMFLATGEARYMDMAEISLYNNVLAGVNLAGDRFFYVNVLEADGETPFNHGNAGRSPWFGTACCPSNLARLIPQIPGMAYARTGDDVYCGFYMGGSAAIELEADTVDLIQKTSYPFDGNVSIVVNPRSDEAEFTLWLRIPTWCGDRFIPGELYSYAAGDPSEVSVKINGREVRTKAKDGYVPISRKWKSGDVVQLDMDMPVRYSVADERVEADRNRVAVSRGPLLYCAEQPDNEYPANAYIISDISQAGKVSRFDEGRMKGIPSVSLSASVDESSCGCETLTLIPYYSWNNRGDGMSMNVWFMRR